MISDAVSSDNRETLIFPHTRGSLSGQYRAHLTYGQLAHVRTEGLLPLNFRFL